MSTYVEVVISPATTTRPVVISVSQATRAAGSFARTASRTESEIWSATLSGWPSVTDSEVKRKLRWPMDGATLADGSAVAGRLSPTQLVWRKSAAVLVLPSADPYTTKLCSGCRFGPIVGGIVWPASAASDSTAGIVSFRSM